MLRRVCGVPVFLLGLALTGWVIYNVFIERLAETRDRNPLPGIVFGIGFLYAGANWMRGKQAGRI